MLFIPELPWSCIRGAVDVGFVQPQWHSAGDVYGGSSADMQPAGVQQAAQADFFLAGNSPERKPKTCPLPLNCRGTNQGGCGVSCKHRARCASSGQQHQPACCLEKLAQGHSNAK